MLGKRQRQRKQLHERPTAASRRSYTLTFVCSQVLSQLHLRNVLAEPAGRLFTLCVNQNYVQVRLRVQIMDPPLASAKYGGVFWL